MPRRRQPESLENSCIHCVVYHELIWEREDFTRLPASLTDKLVDKVLQRMQTHGPHLLGHFQRSSFFGVKINHVSYKSWPKVFPRHMTCYSALDKQNYKSDMHRCFVRFLQSSKHLVDLELDLDFNLLPVLHDDAAFHLLSGCDLSKLQVLTLKSVKSCENTMELLGSSCPRLRELYLENFLSVDDDTIKVLIKKDEDGQCLLKHLKVIDVRNTRISSDGVRHVLDCIPTITHLYYPNVPPAALQLLRHGRLTHPLYLEYLEVINPSGLLYYMRETNSIPLLLSAFLNVKSIVIILSCLSDAEDLTVFHSLKSLRKLKIRTDPEHSFLCRTIPASILFTPNIKTKHVVFKPWISTFIQITGSNLCELWLEDITYFSFSTVGKTCPNLHCFRVHFWSVQSDECPTDLQSYFRNVETLCLLQGVSSNMTHPETEQIILSLIEPMDKLKSLELSDIKMSETFLFSLLSRNSLAVIETIDLAACDIQMMNDDIVSFIGQCAKLKKLSIRHSTLYDRLHELIPPDATDPELIAELAYRGWDVELLLDMHAPCRAVDLPGPDFHDDLDLQDWEYGEDWEDDGNDMSSDEVDYWWDVLLFDE